MPEGTRAGGAMPGPLLDVHGAAAAAMPGAADASSGTRRVTSRTTVAKYPAVRRSKVGDGLRNEVKTVLLRERERV